MAKMTLEDLRKLRGAKKEEFTQRDHDNKTAQIIVGMGTCGIAAGAKDTFDAILEELKSASIDHVALKQTGCMGLCHSEPTVEVVVPDMPSVVYGNVDAELGKRIVRKHILKKELINDHIFDKPAADLVK